MMHSERQAYHPAGMGGELLRMQGWPQASAAQVLRPGASRASSTTRAAAPQGQSRAAAQVGRHQQSWTQQWQPALAAGLLGDLAALLRLGLNLLMLGVLAQYPELEARVTAQPGAEQSLRGRSAQSHSCLVHQCPWLKPALALMSPVQHCFLQVLCWGAPSDLLG